MIKLPYFEDITSVYFNYIYQTLYPNIEKNRFLVYTLATLHVLGVLMIGIGPYLPSEYQPFVLLYLIIVALSYSLFRGHCFMTLMANKFSGIKDNVLHIRMSTAKKGLIFNIIVALIGTLYPKYSAYNIIKKLIFN